MTESKHSPDHDTKLLPWLFIVIEALAPYAGQTLPPGRVYAAIAQHPHAKIRLEFGERRVRKKINEGLRFLRRYGCMWTVDDGRWHIH